MAQVLRPSDGAVASADVRLDGPDDPEHHPRYGDEDADGTRKNDEQHRNERSGEPTDDHNRGRYPYKSKDRGAKAHRHAARRARRKLWEPGDNPEGDRGGSARQNQDEGVRRHNSSIGPVCALL
jgi:hypothetical protein